METITLMEMNGCWVAVFSDESHAIKELFGTNTLPTPFSAEQGHEIVQEYIQARNPDKIVK